MRTRVLTLAVALAALAVPSVASAADHYGLGYIPPKTPIAHVAKTARSLASLPDSYSLRQYANIPGDQGKVGSCVAWGDAWTGMGILENRDKANNQFENPANLWSVGGSAPMYMYSQINGGSDNGAFISDGAILAKTQGVDDWADYTQGPTDWADLPTPAEHANAANWKLADWQEINVDQASIEAAIAAGEPVQIGMQVTWAFEDNTSGNYPDPNLAYEDYHSVGGHAPTIVGYDTTGVVVENSWGPFWDNGGYVHIDWSWITGDTTDSVRVNVDEAVALTGMSHYTPAPPTPPPVLPTPKPKPGAPKITTHPKKVEGNHKAIFRFTDSTSGVTFIIKMDKSKWTKSTSPKKYTRVKKGTHTFEVQAWNYNGGSAIVKFVWKER